MTSATISSIRTPRARPQPARCSIAIFDLDRTLVPGSSLMQLGKALADRKVVNRSTVARHAIGATMFARRGRPFCHGQGKLERLEAEMGPMDLSLAAAYADSASDLPLLTACGRPVAVNPDRRLRRAASSAGWPVLRLS